VLPTQQNLKKFLKRKKKKAELAGLQSMVQMFLIREVLVSQYSGRPRKRKITYIKCIHVVLAYWKAMEMLN
jgi:hypothetical protein